MRKLILLSAILIFIFNSCGKNNNSNKSNLTDSLDDNYDYDEEDYDYDEEEDSYNIRWEAANEKLEALKSNNLSETIAFYENNQPMFINFLDTNTLKKTYLAKFDYYGSLIFLVPFNEKGEMHGEFFDDINEGYYENGVLTCKNCMLVSSNQPMVFSYNYSNKNTYLTFGDILRGRLVGNFKVQMNTEKKIYDTKQEVLYIGNQANIYDRIIPRGTGTYILNDLYESDYPFNEYGVYDGEVIRTIKNKDVPGKNITIKFFAENGKVRRYIKKDHNGNIIDSISNDFKIWKINFKYVKKPGFPIFSDPGSFADLPSLFKDAVEDYSPFRDAFDRTKFKSDIKYSITNSPVVLIGGETNLKKSEFEKDFGFDPNQVYVPHEANLGFNDMSIESPIKWFNENEDFQSVYESYQYKNKYGEINIGGSDKYKYYKFPPNDTGGPRSILDENGLWSIRKKNNKLLYEAYSEIGEPYQLSELGKSFLSNDSLKTQVNFHNVGQGFNLFYAAYNVVKGDLVLEKIKPRSWYSGLWNAFFHRNVNDRTMGNIKLNEEYVEWNSKSWRKIQSDDTNHSYERPSSSHPWVVNHDSKYRISLKDIFYGGKYSIVTYENYFKSFHDMHKATLNRRDIWVYENQSKNWEKVNFEEIIELATIKDNSIRPEYERSLKEKQEAERKAKEEADRIAWEEYIEVSLRSVQKAPEYPGCEDIVNKKYCFSENIEKFFLSNLNFDLVRNLGLTGRQRIQIAFKIDKSGDVVDISASIRGPYERIEDEAIRVLSLLPKMQPGFQRGREVFVSYQSSILIEVK